MYVDGINIINATPHEIRFLCQDGSISVVPKCGYTLAASAVEADMGTWEIDNCEIQLVKTVFEGTEQGHLEIDSIEFANPDSIIVGSIISAQAYPGRVMSLVPVPGTERSAPQDKLYLPNKFNVF